MLRSSDLSLVGIIKLTKGSGLGTFLKILK